MTSETLDDHAYIPAALAAAEPVWVTNLLAKLQHLDTNVNALRFEVATLRESIHGVHSEVTSLRNDVGTSDLSNINGTSIATAAASLPELAVEVARLRRTADELPVILANSQASNRAPLYNPTTYMPSPESLLQRDGSWAEELVPPNPTSRNELMDFTVEQCIASAANLNLPPLPENTA
ncbi:hypothetical protein M413DRAFT_449877, partial [Hebeloma cylindrosporum]